MEYTNSQMRELIAEHIHNHRDRCLMTERLIDGMHYEPLAEKYDLSTVQVKRIVHREQSRLLRYINDP